jgi:SAM-dependent methyltransferase
MLDPLRERAGRWSRVVAAVDDAMALLAVREIGALDALRDGPATASALGSRLGVGPRRLRAFLDVVADIGLLGREGAGAAALYSLDPRDEALLDADSDGAQLLPVEDLRTLFGRRAQALDVLRSDQGVEVASSGGAVSDSERAGFLRYLDRHARAEASEVAELLSDEPIARLADLGCGAGTYTFAVLSRNRPATAVLLDRPNASALVNGSISAAGLDERARFLGADLHEDSWVREVDGPLDAVILSNVVHNHDPSSCRALVRRAAALLRPGGRLVLKEFRMNDDGAGPPGALRFALSMALMSPGGDLYTCPEIASWLTEAGLDPGPAIQLLTAPESFVFLARKP